MQRSRPLTVKAAWDRAEVWILLVAGALCGCGGPTPAVEEPCGEDESCEAALCYEGTCLDPDGDEDGDGLRDLVELELGTDPTSVDSDNDGLIDSYEIASVDDPTDSDGDGKLDALESVQTDGDCDGISDQDDPVEDPMSDEGIQVDLDGDGVFDICLTDSDADGLADKYDCEPSDPEIGASCPDPSPCLIGVCEAGIS